MRVLILGVDGYLGWSLAKHLASEHPEWTLAGVDCYKRRDWVASVGGHSATPICRMTIRLEAYNEVYGKSIAFYRGDLLDAGFVEDLFRSFKPDAVVHLAEMPSAPYSMIGARQACETHRNNVEGTLNVLFSIRAHAPQAHLLKIGTLGEYGTPNVDIPEGEFEIEFRGRKDVALFPRRPGSFYHLTKVHDTHNVHFACRAWGLRSTDVMQGVVYGLRTDHEDGKAQDPRMITRFDFDAVFGTAINRFCAQAVCGEPITVYGAGSQRRGFLPLKDSMRCLTLALEQPPEAGRYRTFNQFEQVLEIRTLAKLIAVEADAIVLKNDKTKVVFLENPREGGELSCNHYYNPDCEKLKAMGYEPTMDLGAEVRKLITDLCKYRGRIAARRSAFIPDIQWRGTRQPSAERKQIDLGECGRD